MWIGGWVAQVLDGATGSLPGRDGTPLLPSVLWVLPLFILQVSFVIYRLSVTHGPFCDILEEVGGERKLRSQGHPFFCIQLSLRSKLRSFLERSC